ncbi:Ribosomal protein S19, mitochondrial, partial [Ananas comosus]
MLSVRMKKNRESLLSRKIWSRRSSISPEFVDCSVLIYNGKTPVRCKITEGKVGHKFGEFASTRRRRPYRTNRGKGKKGFKFFVGSAQGPTLFKYFMRSPTGELLTEALLLTGSGDASLSGFCMILESSLRLHKEPEHPILLPFFLFLASAAAAAAAAALCLLLH